MKWNVIVTRPLEPFISQVVSFSLQFLAINHNSCCSFQVKATALRFANALWNKIAVRRKWSGGSPFKVPCDRSLPFLNCNYLSCLSIISQPSGTQKPPPQKKRRIVWDGLLRLWWTFVWKLFDVMNHFLSFLPQFFATALSVAVQEKMSLVIIHHPLHARSLVIGQ